MKSINEHIEHLNAQEIQDYVTGKMDHREAHRIEKHLQSCAFCEEAIEGTETYFGKSGFATDIDVMRHRLQSRVGAKRKLAIPYTRIAIAASIAMLIGVSAFWMWEVGDQVGLEEQIVQQEEIVQEKATKAENKDASTELIEENTEEMEAEIESPAVALKKEETSAKDLIVEEIAEEDFLEDVAISEEPAPIENKFFQTDKNRDDQLGDGPGNLEKEEIATIPPQNENPVISEVTIADKEKLKKSAITKSAIELDEAVSSSKRFAAEEASKPKTLPSQEPLPIGGMKNFEKYVSQKLRYPKSALDNKVKGKVRVSFSVDRNGALSGFKIVKGLGHGCDEEAIRLIKEGPQWTPASENGQPTSGQKEIDIRFK